MRLLKFDHFFATALLLLLPSTTVVGRPLVVGGFSSDRVGVGNLVDGFVVEDFRSLILSEFPEATFVGTDLLRPSFLDTVDFLIIGAATISGVTYLTAEEQQSLLAYVKAGGGALIFSENDTHAGVPTSDEAAETFLDVFGVSSTEHLDAVQIAKPLNTAHPVINGPFGAVASIATYHSGWFNEFPSYVERLADYESNEKAALLAIAPGELGPGSGGVVFIGDASLLIDTAEGGLIAEQDNSKLLLNVTAYVVPEPSSLSLGLIGIAIYAARRRRSVSRG